MAVEHVGIDLGTTTSGLAYVRSDGNPEIVPNADGERLTPSVVYFDKHEKVKLVGSSARDGGDPNRTVHFVKRHMDDPDYLYQVDSEKWTPSEISALILAKLERECSQIIGDIEDVVITVPANFNELARTSTVNAGRIAGLNVTRLVNEPTAAALYYAHIKNVTGNILVYDLGGGTLDITVLNVDPKGNVRILTSEGVRHLGGSNFDEIILDLFSNAYLDAYGEHLFGDETQRRRALQSSEDAKRMLSKLRKVTETIGNDRVGIARVELTRDMFEDAVGRLLTRTVLLIEQALASAELQARALDHVVLVGGSTRIPRVREILMGITGREPLTCGNVDEVVALGAALFAKNGNKVSEVCNQSYGTVAIIEDHAAGTADFQNSVVIPKNTPIPCSMSQTYVTSEDDEKIIEVEVTQGEDLDPRYVDIIGKIELEVPPNRPAGCEVHVTYGYDESQRINARVTDVETGKSKDVAIAYHGIGVLAADEVEKRIASFKDIRIE